MADKLCFLTQSHSHKFKKIPNLQCIILHDLFLICSFVASYPLYSSYFIFFSPYLIKIVSFVSPLFIAAVILSLLLTTTTAFCPKLPQLELEILQTVIHELKSNLDDVNGDEEECNLENFEIYKFVFDASRSIMFGNEGVDEVEEQGEKLLGDEDVDQFEEEKKNLFLKEMLPKDSVHGGRRNDITTSCSIEVESSLVKLMLRWPEKNLSMKEKVLEDSVHGGRKNDNTASELDIDKFEEENSLVKLISRRSEKKLSLKETVLEDFVHGGRKNDIATSELDMDEFEEQNTLVKFTSRRPEKNLSLKETLPEKSVHGGRRNDITTSELDMNIFKEKNSSVKHISRRPEKHLPLPKKSAYGGRRNDHSTSEFYNDKLQVQTDLMKLFEELDRFEEFSTPIKTGADSDKVIGELRKAEPTPTTNFRTGSEAIDSNETDKITQNSGKSAIKVDRSSSWRSNSSSIYGRHGSMSEEKEWRRTLACKLFEERHNSQGGEEGMDSLWEAYEIDNSKNRKDAMIISSCNSKKMMMKMNSNNGGIDEDEDDDEDEEMSNGGLCCLQALKLSTGKMNLGMKKPNLLKISKALKGYGWLHHVKIKHGVCKARMV